MTTKQPFSFARAIRRFPYRGLWQALGIIWFAGWVPGLIVTVNLPNELHPGWRWAVLGSFLTTALIGSVIWFRRVWNEDRAMWDWHDERHGPDAGESALRLAARGVSSVLLGIPLLLLLFMVPVLGIAGIHLLAGGTFLLLHEWRLGFALLLIGGVCLYVALRISDSEF